MWSIFLLLWFPVLCPEMLSGQTLHVIDKSTLEPISGATIQKRNTPPEPLTTNAKGEAQLTGRYRVAQDTLFFFHPEYRTLALTYAELDTLDWQLALQPAAFGTEPVVIATGRFAGLNAAPEPSAQVLSQKRIRMYNSPSTAHLLEDHAATFVQRSQLGGGSPNIRGFEANRVLIVVDGIRVNNAIFRGGHLQNVLGIDVNVLERVEVLNGTGAVEYGSDALGGVMAMFTQEPELSEQEDERKVDGNAMVRYGSAANEVTGHVDLNVGRERFASFSSLTITDFGDLRAGSRFTDDLTRLWRRDSIVERIDGRDSIIANDNPLVQSPSGYTQIDGLQKFRFRPNDRNEHLLNFHFSSTSFVPRYDRLTDTTAAGRLRRADWYYGPQLRLTAAYRYTHKNTTLYDQLTTQAAYQQFRESRHTRRFGSDWLNSRYEKVDVLSLNVNAGKQIGSKHQLYYGADVQYNFVASQARRQHIELQDSTRDLDTRYPDGGSRMGFAAAFVRHVWQPRRQWHISSAIRYTYTWLASEFNDKQFYPFLPDAINTQHQAFTGALEAQYRPRKWLQPYLRFNTAFRSPNVDDVGKVFDSEPGSVIIPNENIQPEYTYTAEGGMTGLLNERLRYQLNVYATVYDNALGFAPSRINGADSIEYEGVRSRVMQIENLERGLLYGFQFSGTLTIIGPLSFRQQLGFTKGYILKTKRPLSHIPPLFGLSEIQLNIRQFTLRTNLRYNGQKAINDYAPGGEDNLRYATKNGMLAWWTLNLYSEYTFLYNLSLSLGFENLLDTHYRTFASGISRPGFNVVCSLRARF